MVVDLLLTFVTFGLVFSVGYLIVMMMPKKIVYNLANKLF